MATLAHVEAALIVRVCVTLRAEGATDAELAAWAKRHPDEVAGAVESLLERPRRLVPEVEAGWLDDDRAVFVTDVTSADADRPETVAPTQEATR